MNYLSLEPSSLRGASASYRRVARSSVDERLGLAPGHLKVKERSSKLTFTAAKPSMGARFCRVTLVLFEFLTRLWLGNVVGWGSAGGNWE